MPQEGGGFKMGVATSWLESLLPDLRKMPQQQEALALMQPGGSAPITTGRSAAYA